MKREEATQLLKEVVLLCDGLNEQGIMLMPPNSNNVLSHGYQLHIKTVSSSEVVECLRPVVEKHKLALSNEPEKQLLIIYRPLKTKQT